MAKEHGLQELRKRAAAVGIDDAQIEAAREGESPKKDVRCPSAGTGVLWAFLTDLFPDQVINLIVAASLKNTNG